MHAIAVQETDVLLMSPLRGLHPNELCKDVNYPGPELNFSPLSPSKANKPTSGMTSITGTFPVELRSACGFAVSPRAVPSLCMIVSNTSRGGNLKCCHLKEADSSEMLLEHKEA